ncbi:portal protein, partial [Pseudomonas aeruginosa]|uniref:portal protein n=1 Tax=Pseudomonas aeruginosa TaxID=287 RepID=UPI0039C17368
KDILRRVSSARGDRGNWESHWTEIAELVLPSYSDMFQSQTNYPTPGQKKTDKLFDATAPGALTRFASVMESILTPRQQTWHNIK